MLSCLMWMASSAVLSADHPSLSAAHATGRHGGKFGAAVVLSRMVSGSAWEPGLIAPYHSESASVAPAQFDPDTEYFMPAVRSPSGVDHPMQTVDIDPTREFFIRVPPQFESGTIDLSRIFRRNPGQE